MGDWAGCRGLDSDRTIQNGIERMSKRRITSTLYEHLSGPHHIMSLHGRVSESAQAKRRVCIHEPHEFTDKRGGTDRRDHDRDGRTLALQKLPPLARWHLDPGSMSTA